MTRGWMLFEIADCKPNAFRDGLSVAVVVVVNVLYLAVISRGAKKFFDP